MCALREGVVAMREQACSGGNGEGLLHLARDGLVVEAVLAWALVPDALVVYPQDFGTAGRVKLYGDNRIGVHSHDFAVLQQDERRRSAEDFLDGGVE